MSLKNCSVCGQKADIYTTIHKGSPFVDNKNHPVVCFTCYFVPKLLEQRYGEDGAVLEEKELEYGCKNLHTPKELYESGASDTLKQAKVSVDAVRNLCKKVRTSKKPSKRPLASWNIA